MEKLLPRYAEFCTHLHHTIDEVWGSRTYPQYLKLLATHAQSVCEGMLALGDFAAAFVAEPEQVPYGYYRLNYVWPEQAKAFLILWRDVLFEAQKGHILQAEGRLKAEVPARYRQIAGEKLKQAARELQAFFEEELPPEKEQQAHIARWRLQKNPWPVFKEQLQRLSQQCQDIQQQYLQLKEIVELFDRIRQHVQTAMAFCEKEILEFEQQAKHIIEDIKQQFEENSSSKFGKISAKLEDFDNFENLPHHLNVFSQQVEEAIEEIPERMQVVVATLGGLVQYKEISFRRAVRLWEESKLMPLMYEIWEVTENARSSIGMGLVNIRNRAALLAAEAAEEKSPEISLEDMVQPIQLFVNKVSSWKKELAKQKKEVNLRLRQEFLLSAIYKQEEEFLPLPLQSAIRNLAENQNEFLEEIWSWTQHQVATVRKLIQKVEKEESLSTSEKLVRFIRNWSMDETNHDYNAIFQTRGYIGESFWVGRKAELAHIEKLIQSWEKGFRGGVILSGNRFCGKTLFGEVVANRHFHKRTIRLSPDSMLRVEGRRMHVGYDLGEALEFIRKYTLHKRPLIWIDDLGLWWDHHVPLRQNTRQLQRYLDNYPGSQFFMVSMNNWLKYHLGTIRELNRIFHSTINLDRVSLEECMQAIWIRHGATNKLLVDQQGEELSPKQIQKIVTGIYKAARGNIGEVLYRWAACIQWVDEKRVQFVPKASYSLPDFLTPDMEVLLSAILMEKRTNEYWLRKLFGPPFKDKYSHILNQLISLGLLVRHRDGWLEIHEAAVNELSRMLALRQSLNLDI